MRRQGIKDKAFAIFDQMVKNGYGPADMLNAEDELIPLRSDARWKTITEVDPTSAPVLDECVNGRMVFYWKTNVLQRMTYEKEGPDRVRQLIDTSTDEGKTWSPGYNGLYIRRK